jgi:hypothetical protein
MLAGAPGLLSALQPSTPLARRCGSVRALYRLTASAASVVAGDVGEAGTALHRRPLRSKFNGAQLRNREFYCPR